jgi:hypothetical protein
LISNIFAQLVRQQHNVSQNIANAYSEPQNSHPDLTRLKSMLQGFMRDLAGVHVIVGALEESETSDAPCNVNVMIASRETPVISNLFPISQLRAATEDLDLKVHGGLNDLPDSV